MLANPNATCGEVAERFNTTLQVVYNARHILRKRASGLIAQLDMVGTKKNTSPVAETKIEVKPEPKPQPKVEPKVEAKPAQSVDMVNNPPHYKVGGLETIDILKAKLSKEEYRGYLKGNVIKYATRAGHKGASAEDAGKLAWYAQRLAELGE